MFSVVEGNQTCGVRWNVNVL